MMLYVIALIVLSSLLCFLHIQARFEFKENTQDFYFYFFGGGVGGGGGGGVGSLLSNSFDAFFCCT